MQNPDARAGAARRRQALPVPWLELYPAEFALAPQAAQAVTVELRPERARNETLAPAAIRCGASISPRRRARLPPDLEARITVLPPLATCPHCGADLPEGARECRRCGERIRLCPVCGAPNTWLARVCRRSRGTRPAHGDRLADGAGRRRGPRRRAGRCRWGSIWPGAGRRRRFRSAGPRTRRVERAAGGFRHGGRLGHRAGPGRATIRRSSSRRARLSGSSTCPTPRASTRTGALWRCPRTARFTPPPWAGRSSPWTRSGARAAGRPASPGTVYGGVTVAGDSLLVPAGKCHLRPGPH